MTGDVGFFRMAKLKPGINKLQSAKLTDINRFLKMCF